MGRVIIIKYTHLTGQPTPRMCSLLSLPCRYPLDSSLPVGSLDSLVRYMKSVLLQAAHVT